MSSSRFVFFCYEALEQLRFVHVKCRIFSISEQ